MTYKGKPYTVELPRADVYARLSDLSKLSSRMDEIPEELRQRMGTVTFPDADTFAFTAPGVGEMKFRIVERTPDSRVRFLADTGLMPINVIIDLADEGADRTSVSASIEADIPLMLRPLVGGKLQQAADQFGEMFGKLNQ